MHINLFGILGTNNRSKLIDHFNPKFFLCYETTVRTNGTYQHRERGSYLIIDVTVGKKVSIFQIENLMTIHETELHILQIGTSRIERCNWVMRSIMLYKKRTDKSTNMGIFPNGEVGETKFNVSRLRIIMIIERIGTIAVNRVSLIVIVMEEWEISMGNECPTFKPCPNITGCCIFRRQQVYVCLLYTSPSPRDVEESRMPSSA